MTVDQVFIIKKLQNLDEMLVAYSAVTRMPFAICDDESFNDQVWIFTDQDKLKTFAEKYKDEKKSQLKGWLVIAYLIGSLVLYFVSLFIY